MNHMRDNTLEIESVNFFNVSTIYSYIFNWWKYGLEAAIFNH